MFKEKMPSPEREKVITRVILEFMRHGKKETDRIKSDEDIRLSEEGKGQAISKGKRLAPQPEVAVAYGSPKKRTQETAAHIMLADEESIDPSATLEEMEKVIAKELRFGKKIIEDKKLGFETAGPEGQELAEAFKAGKYLSFLIENSDKRAIELADKESPTYLRYAGNIAILINRYAKIGDNFNRIASKTDKYEKFGNQLERYLATHQGIVEGFLAKVLEKIYGKEKRDEFIKSAGGGFKETEGIRVEIINDAVDQKIKILYKLGDKEEAIEIDRGLLQDIIKERKIFEEKVEQANS